MRPPAVELDELDPTVRGRLLYDAFYHALDNIKVSNLSKAEIVEAIRSGHFSFLLDGNGQFIEQGMIEDSQV